MCGAWLEYAFGVGVDGGGDLAAIVGVLGTNTREVQSLCEVR